MVSLASRKEEDSKEKSIISKEEEEFTCLIGREIKESYASKIKKGGERKAMAYL